MKIADRFAKQPSIPYDAIRVHCQKDGFEVSFLLKGEVVATHTCPFVEGSGFTVSDLGTLTL